MLLWRGGGDGKQIYANRFAVLCSVVCSFPFPDFTAYISHVETEKCREIEIKTQEFDTWTNRVLVAIVPSFLSLYPLPTKITQQGCVTNLIPNSVLLKFIYINIKNNF